MGWSPGVPLMHSRDSTSVGTSPQAGCEMEQRPPPMPSASAWGHMSARMAAGERCSPPASVKDGSTTLVPGVELPSLSSMVVLMVIMVV